MSAPSSTTTLYPTENSGRTRHSPASTGSDSWSWSSSASVGRRDYDAPSSRNSTSPASGQPFLFVTANNPAGFKKKDVLQQIRKKAMNNYLENRPPKPPASGLQSSSSLAPANSIQSDGSLGLRDPHVSHDLMSSEEALKIYRGESRRARSSLVGSAASAHIDDHSLSSSEGAFQHATTFPAARILPTNDLLSPPQSMVQPMRTGMVLQYDAYKVGPLLSVDEPIGTPFDPFRTMPQISHPRVSVEQLKYYCSQLFGTKAMGTDWIPAVVKRRHAFLSTLCIASAYLDAYLYHSVESIPTMAVRQEVMSMIDGSLSNPHTRIDDFNIMALAQLICSEVIVGNEFALQYHESGVETMVKMRGGLGELGVSGRIASILTWVSFESAVFREQQPSSTYLDWIPRGQIYPPSATIPESPLFCPRPGFPTLRQSQQIGLMPHILDLIEDVRNMTGVFLDSLSATTAQAQRRKDQNLKALYERILTRPARKTGDHEWSYEACRIAAVIQATAMITRSTLSEAASVAAQTQASLSETDDMPPVSHPLTRTDSALTSTSVYFPPPSLKKSSPSQSLLSCLRVALERSDLSTCWGDMIGVLLWISLVGGAAARRSNKPLKKWLVSVAIRCSIVLAFEHGDAVVSSSRQLLRVTEKLGAEKGPREGWKVAEATATESRTEKGAGKRRRVDGGVAGLPRSSRV